jgi:hypothetical protein
MNFFRKKRQKKLLEDKIYRFVLKSDFNVMRNYELGKRYLCQINNLAKKPIKYDEKTIDWIEKINKLYESREKNMIVKKTKLENGNGLLEHGNGKLTHVTIFDKKVLKDYQHS